MIKIYIDKKFVDLEAWLYIDREKKTVKQIRVEDGRKTVMTAHIINQYGFSSVDAFIRSVFTSGGAKYF